jgi:cbb3-type cytochrome oxidase maturation protein
MSAIIILLIASISVAALFLAGFIWSVRNGQYDDEISPPLRILMDDRNLQPPLSSPGLDTETSHPVSKQKTSL